MYGKLNKEQLDNLASLEPAVLQAELAEQYRLVNNYRNLIQTALQFIFNNICPPLEMAKAANTDGLVGQFIEAGMSAMLALGRQVSGLTLAIEEDRVEEYVEDGLRETDEGD